VRPRWGCTPSLPPRHRFAYAVDILAAMVIAPGVRGAADLDALYAGEGVPFGRRTAPAVVGQGAPRLRQCPGPVGPLLVAEPLSRVSLRLPSCMFLGGSGED